MIISLVVLALLIMFTYSNFKNGLTSETINVRNINVEIIGGKNEVATKYIEDINYIQDGLIPLAAKIVLTVNDVSEQAGVKTDNEYILANANAVTTPENKTIYINTNTYNDLTLQHEFYHLLDYSKQISESEKFREMMDRNLEYLNLNAYQSSCYQEMFVAVMLEYQYNKEELKVKCPEVEEFGRGIESE